MDNSTWTLHRARLEVSVTDTKNKEKKSARTPTHKLAIAFKKENV